MCAGASSGRQNRSPAHPNLPWLPTEPFSGETSVFQTRCLFLYNGSHLTNRLCADHYIQRSVVRSSRSVNDC